MGAGAGNGKRFSRIGKENKVASGMLAGKGKWSGNGYITGFRGNSIPQKAEQGIDQEKRAGRADPLQTAVKKFSAFFMDVGFDRCGRHDILSVRPAVHGPEPGR